MAAVTTWCERCEMYTDHNKLICALCRKIDKVLAQIKDPDPFFKEVKRRMLKRQLLKNEAVNKSTLPNQDTCRLLEKPIQKKKGHSK